MADPAEKFKPFRSMLWPPPGDPGAAHEVIPGTKDCASECPCWSARRGKPQPTTLLLVHAPSESDLTRALCGSEGEVTGVTFHSVVTCPECREKEQGKVRDFLGRGSSIVLRASPVTGAGDHNDGREG